MKVVRPTSRLLNNKMPRCGEVYLKNLERNIIHHQLLKRLNDIHRSNLSQEAKAERINVIDQEGRDYMVHREKECRKIKCCRIPYSPEALIWIRRA
jgi:hypothetical protein